MTDLQWHETTAGADYPHRAALAMMAHFWRKPWALVVPVLLLLMLLVALVDGDWISLLVFALAFGSLAALQYWIYRRQCGRAVTPSAVVRAALGPHELLLEDPTGSAAIPYATVRAVRVRRGFVVLTRRRLPPVGFAAAMLPDDALAELRVRIAGRPQPAPLVSTAAEPGDIVKAFVPDRRYPGQAGWAGVRAVFLGRPRLTVVAAIVVVGVVGFYVTGGAGGVIVCAAFLVLLVAVMYLSCRRAVRRQQPPGSTVSFVIGADGVRADWATARVEAPYSTFDRVDRRGDVLLLRVQASNGFWMLPASVLSHDEVALLRARIESH